ncbi:MAG: DMT family transporter [Burkholderiaceae bacterium]|nr:DMT family transporter [Burkholderiaceae bacterium]MCD8564534.1 DMT family transporter [Burkholderiaceae bacterium]
MQNTQLTRSDVWLLAMVTLAWGLSFPIIKIAVTTYPPLAFRAIGLVIGIIFLGIYLLRAGQTIKVPKSEWFSVLKIILITMTLWQIGLVYGVKLLNGGRAAIIGYTFPVWALIGSIVFYGATFTWRSIAGAALAISAVTLLTVNELDNFLNYPTGILVMLLAAMAWGFGTAITRHTPLSITNQVLALWSLIITLAVFLPLSYWVEATQWRWPNSIEMMTMGYSGIVTFVFCYIAWYRLSRKLPAAISGISIMLVPAIGVGSSALLLGEKVTLSDIAALILIIAAMFTVLRQPKPVRKPAVSSKAE